MAKLHMNLRQSDQDRIEAILGKTDLEDMTSVVRQALKLYDRVTDHVRGGGELLMKGTDGWETRLELLEIRQAPRPVDDSEAPAGP